MSFYQQCSKLTDVTPLVGISFYTIKTNKYDQLVEKGDFVRKESEILT